MNICLRHFDNVLELASCNTVKTICINDELQAQKYSPKFNGTIFQIPTQTPIFPFVKKRICLLLMLLPVLAHAGIDNSPLGARSAGMGGSSVALAGDLWCVHNNQAGLAFVRDVQGGLFYENRFMVKALSMKAGAFALPIKRGTFGLEVSSFGYTQYAENKYGLSYAMPFGEKFAMGVQVDYMSMRFGENYGKAGTATGEIGVIAKPLKNLTIGAHLFNPMRSKLAAYNDERVPTIMRFGVNYRFSDKVFITGEAEKDMDYKPVIRGGLEYRPIKEFYLRAGGGSNPGTTSFGFGIAMKNLRLDVASSFHAQLGFTPHVGLQYGIGDKKSDVPSK